MCLTQLKKKEILLNNFNIDDLDNLLYNYRNSNNKSLIYKNNRIQIAEI